MNALQAILFALIFLFGGLAIAFFISGALKFHERGMTYANKHPLWSIIDSIALAGLGILTLGIAKHWLDEKQASRYILVGLLMTLLTASVVILLNRT